MKYQKIQLSKIGKKTSTVNYIFKKKRRRKNYIGTLGFEETTFSLRFVLFSSFFLFQYVDFKFCFKYV